MMVVEVTSVRKWHSYTGYIAHDLSKKLTPCVCIATVSALAGEYVHLAISDEDLAGYLGQFGL